MIVMPSWIVIASIKRITLYDRMPKGYLFEHGFSEEEILNDINFKLLNAWEERYLKEKKEGMTIYILPGNYTSPSRHLFQKYILTTYSQDSLSNFKRYTPNRYKIWEDVRDNTKEIYKLFLRHMPLKIEQLGFYQNWKVVNIETEDVCEVCSSIVKKGSLIEKNDKDICKHCHVSYKKISTVHFGYIYFVKESQTGLIKIGKATNVEKRFFSLKVGIPFEIELIHKIQSNNYHLSEQLFHKHFYTKKVTGEWYNLSDKDIEWIKTLNDDEFHNLKNY
ncbi:hypothetical protein GI482_07075 [Bacillus sp. N3536]|nr:hypothetical protein GI482_07075 [Bacillus sp. N3536]